MTSPIGSYISEPRIVMSNASSETEKQIDAAEKEALENIEHLPKQKQDQYKTMVRQGVNKIRMHIANLRAERKTEYEISKAIITLVHDFKISNENFIQKNQLWNNAKDEVRRNFNQNTNNLNNLNSDFGKIQRCTNRLNTKTSNDEDTETLHFPDADAITKCFSKSSLFNDDYWITNGVSKAIVKLASERFANSEKFTQGVKLETALMFDDLIIGKDGFTGQALPNLGKTGVSSAMWNHISMETQEILVDCASSNMSDILGSQCSQSFK